MTTNANSSLIRAAKDLYDKLRVKFPDLSMGDEKSKVTENPEEARKFKFTYKSGSGEKFGSIIISISDLRELKIFYSKNITEDLDDDQKQEWFGFLRDIRMFARRYMLSFDIKDITRDAPELKAEVSESKLYGKKKVSYQDVDKNKSVKLKIRHSAEIDENVQGSRARKIESIFIETQDGERFKLPFNDLHGARAMAQHVLQGGHMHDEVGQHIHNLVHKARAMRRFISAVRNKTFESSDATEMTECAFTEYNNVTKALKSMRGPRGYKSFVENFTPDTPAQFDENEMKEKFTRKIFDDRLAEAFPFVYKAYIDMKKSKVKEASMKNSIPSKKESRFTPGMEQIVNAGKGRVAILIADHPHIVGFGDFLRIGETGLVHVRLTEPLEGWASGDQIAVRPSELRNPAVEEYLPDNSFKRPGQTKQVTELKDTPKGTKKFSKAGTSPAEYEDPVVVDGVGTMPAKLAQKHYKDLKHTPTKLYNKDSKK